MLLVAVRPRTMSGLRSVASPTLWFAFVGSLYVWDGLVTSLLLRSDTRIVTEFVSSPTHLPSFSLPSNAYQMRSRLCSEMYSPSSNCLIIAKTAGSCSNCRPLGAAGPDEAWIWLSYRSAIFGSCLSQLRQRWSDAAHVKEKSLSSSRSIPVQIDNWKQFQMLHKLIPFFVPSDIFLITEPACQTWGCTISL